MWNDFQHLVCFMIPALYSNTEFDGSPLTQRITAVLKFIFTFHSHLPQLLWVVAPKGVRVAPSSLQRILSRLLNLGVWHQPLFCQIVS